MELGGGCGGQGGHQGGLGGTGIEQQARHKQTNKLQARKLEIVKCVDLNS